MEIFHFWKIWFSDSVDNFYIYLILFYINLEKMIYHYDFNNKNNYGMRVALGICTVEYIGTV